MEAGCDLAPAIEFMTNQDKIRSPWAQLGLLLRLVGLAFLGLFVLGLIINALPRPLSNTTRKLMQLCSTIVLFGVPAFFYARGSFPDRPLYHLGFRPAERNNFYLLAILLL